MKKLLVTIIACAFLAACAGNPSRNTLASAALPPLTEFKPGSELNIKYIGPSSLKFHGLANYDNLDAEHGQMVYPGGHPAVFLASILIHAATIEGVKSSQKTKRQEDADLVLTPYKDVLTMTSAESCSARLTKDSLAADSLYTFKQLYKGDEVIEDGQWVMEVTPVFYMLQDEGAIVIQNSVVLYSTSIKPTIIYQNTVEVISTAYQGENPNAYWTDNGGQKLIETSAGLLADSIKLAMQDSANTYVDEAFKQETFRFYQEGKKSYERGTLLVKNDNRLTLRTLKGWLKSVPILPSETYDIPSAASVAMNVRGIGVLYN